MRLIDADALDKAFTNLRWSSEQTLAHWGDRKDWCLHGSEIEKLIEDAPTVDPVQHGRWVDDYNAEEFPLFRDGWKCSTCGFRTSYGKPKYCMNCGAQMDGESDE